MLRVFFLLLILFLYLQIHQTRTLQVHFGALCLMATTFWCFLDNSKLHVDENWRKLWDIRIPQKVKVFLWRAALGCLPRRHCLQSRGVKCDDRCVFCERSYENDWHLFFGCDETKSVWEEAELWHIISANLERAGGFVALFFQLLEELLYHQISTFTMTLWGIWKRRNNKMWNGANGKLWRCYRAGMCLRGSNLTTSKWLTAWLGGSTPRPFLALSLTFVKLRFTFIKTLR